MSDSDTDTCSESDDNYKDSDFTVPDTESDDYSLPVCTVVSQPSTSKDTTHSQSTLQEDSACSQPSGSRDTTFFRRTVPGDDAVVQCIVNGDRAVSQPSVSRRTAVAQPNAPNSTAVVERGRKRACNPEEWARKRLTGHDYINRNGKCIERNVPDQSKQNIFIRGSVQARAINRQHPVNNSKVPRIVSFNYFLRYGKDDIRVCKKYFRDT
ncbi:hypothetical protein PR048_029071 [Dryococelus australis]|uniref:Uncharacterized protein n=1 Tax=Dryococelus australis TaxID=614101 RepID=A0ABQ9GCC0_9NEOP|nr:hypothetical protein PR048_029071 [Dryococelus australis]